MSTFQLPPGHVWDDGCRLEFWLRLPQRLQCIGGAPILVCGGHVFWWDLPGKALYLNISNVLLLGRTFQTLDIYRAVSSWVHILFSQKMFFFFLLHWIVVFWKMYRPWLIPQSPLSCSSYLYIWLDIEGIQNYNHSHQNNSVLNFSLASVCLQL